MVSTVKRETVAMLVARGVLEGSYDPRTIYRDEVNSAPPVLDELILIARLDRFRAMVAPSAMITPRSAARVRAAASAPGAIRISSSRTGGAESTSSR